MALTASCSSSRPAGLQLGTTFDGVYTGKRALTKGPTPPCPTEDEATVHIQGDALTFTDSRLRDYPLGFYPHPDGSFSRISAGIGGGFVLIRAASLAMLSTLTLPRVPASIIGI